MDKIYSVLGFDVKVTHCLYGGITLSGWKLSDEIVTQHVLCEDFDDESSRMVLREFVKHNLVPNVSELTSSLIEELEGYFTSSMFGKSAHSLSYDLKMGIGDLAKYILKSINKAEEYFEDIEDFKTNIRPKVLKLIVYYISEKYGSGNFDFDFGYYLGRDKKWHILNMEFYLD